MKNKKFKLFAPSKFQFEDRYEYARFKLTWNISVLFSFLLPLLAFIFYFVENQTVLPTMIGIIATAGFIFYMKRTGKYKAVAVAFSIIGTTLGIFTLNTITTGYHFVDTLWMMIIILFTFFTLDKIWGIIVTISFTLSGVSFILVLSEYNMEQVLSHGYGPPQKITLAVNLVISMVIIVMMVYQFINTRTLAEKEVRNTNEELAKQNKSIVEREAEKTVLLKEIHHRVKNNLQVITSLLRLQSAEVDSTRVNHAFLDTISRVDSMALIHEKIYQQKDLANLNMDEYLKDLINTIINTYSVNKPLNLNISSNIQYIPLKKLVPFALIINELITNSIKHAFHDKVDANITISVWSENNDVSFTYNDYSDFKIENSSSNSFGIELIRLLSDQIDGTLQIPENNSNYWKLTFRL